MLAICVVCLLTTLASAQTPPPGATPPAEVGQGAPELPAQAPLDIVITLFSMQGARDQISVVYGGSITPEQIRQDFAELAAKLGAPAVQPSLSQREGFHDGSAELAGLTNWHQGTLNLDPLIQTYRRYGYFRVVCFFFGASPQPIPPVDRPPLRVVSSVSGSALNVQVWVDQSQGTPDSLPSTAGPVGSGWGLIVGIVAVVLVLLAGSLLIVNVVMTQRKRCQGNAVDGTAD